MESGSSWISGNVREKRALLRGALRGAVIVIITGGLVGLLNNAVSPRRIPLVGLWGKARGVPSPGGEHDPTRGNLEITLADALRFFEEGAFFLDARPEEAYGNGHIPGALSLPEDRFDEDADGVLSMIEPGAVVVTYCRSRECDSAHLLTRELRGAGVESVVFTGGFKVWKEAGYPVEKGFGGDSDAD